MPAPTRDPEKGADVTTALVYIQSGQGDTHANASDDRGRISGQSDPMVNAICGMAPSTCRGSGLDKGMEDVLPALSSLVREGRQRQIQAKARREKEDWLVPQEYDLVS